MWELREGQLGLHKDKLASLVGVTLFLITTGSPRPLIRLGDSMDGLLTGTGYRNYSVPEKLFSAHGKSTPKMRLCERRLSR